MNKVSLRIVVIVAGLVHAGTASAETNLVANIKHDFVAGGKTHSAGTYKVYRLSSEALILQSEQTRASVFLFPRVHENLQLQVKLIPSGGVYYMSEVDTDLRVYAVAEPQVLKPAHQQFMVQSTAQTK